MDKNDFLLKEYELCFEHLRFYDERQGNLLKVLFTLSTSVATSTLAIYQIFNNLDEGFFVLFSLLFAIVFIATILIYFSMIQNRLYFVFVVRQINAIRCFLLEINAYDFKNNQLYISSNVAAFKLFSVHSFKMFGASIISSIFGAATVYGLSGFLLVNRSNWMAFVTFVFVLISELFVGFKYLSIKGNKPSDVAIHGHKDTAKPNLNIKSDR